MVTTLERKQRIYQICSENDIIIIEDDPYYYLQYSLGSGVQLGWSLVSCLLNWTMRDVSVIRIR